MVSASHHLKGPWPRLILSRALRAGAAAPSSTVWGELILPATGSACGLTLGRALRQHFLICQAEIAPEPQNPVWKIFKQGPGLAISSHAPPGSGKKAFTRGGSGGGGGERGGGRDEQGHVLATCQLGMGVRRKTRARLSSVQEMTPLGPHCGSRALSYLPKFRRSSGIKGRHLLVRNVITEECGNERPVTSHLSSSCKQAD